MTKHLRLLMLALLAIICTGGVKAQTIVFQETFDNLSSTGGNDGSWETSVGSNKELSYNDSKLDNVWRSFSKIYPCNKCVKLATKKADGKAVTPVIKATGDFVLSFKAGALKGKKATLTISVSDGTLAAKSFALTAEKFSDYSVKITGVTKDFAITFNVPQQQQSLLDEIKVVAVGVKETTTTTFGTGYDGKIFTFTDGVLEGFTAPKATWTPTEVGGSVAYSSSDKDIVTVDNGGKLKFTNTKFGTATITATFTPKETTKYKISSASYTVVNKEGERIATTIAFAEGIENSIVTVKDGGTFEGYKATCTTEGAKGAIQYSSSNTDVATVDESTGAVTMGSKYGKTVITAQFIGTGGYANSNKISYTIEYKGDYAFYESFDKCDGTDGWSGSVAAGPWDKNKLDNAWTKTGNVFLGAGCIRIGRTASTVTTPSIAISSSAVLTFKAGLWDTKKESTPVIVTISDGTLTYGNNTAKTITLNPSKRQWEEFEIVISGTKSFTLTFKNNDNTDNNRFFLDEVMVKEIAAADVTLDEDKDNVVEAAENANVTLKRTLYKDGGWNTLCLPFSLTDAQAKAAFGDDVELRTLESVSGNTLTFAKATGITAGVPYLIKVNKVAGDKTYTFTGVTTIAVKDETDFGSSENGDVEFIGIYSPADVSEWATAGKENALFLGAANKFYKAKAGTTMKGFRAFFLVPASTDTQALRAVIDGTITGIDDLNIDTVKADGRVYNLNGQCVGYSLEGLKAGIYIQNGKKVIKK